jgi:hypothetical protein
VYVSQQKINKRQLITHSIGWIKMSEYQGIANIIPYVALAGLAGIAGYAYGQGDGARAKVRELYEKVHEPLVSIREGLGLESPKAPEEIIGDMGISYVEDTLKETLEVIANQ